MSGTFQKSKRTDRGVSSLEFALLAIFLIPLIFLTFRLFMLGYNSLTAQFVATHAIRKAVIGRDPNVIASQHLKSIKLDAIDYAGRLGLGLTTQMIEICSARDGSCEADTAASPEELIFVRVSKTLPVFFFGDRTVVGLAFGRNEP